MTRRLNRPAPVSVLAIWACLTFGVALPSSASPITWLYTGTVSSFNNTLVPTGSAATILLTVDPAANLAAGSPFYEANEGAYYFTAVITFTGRQYILQGAYEVNVDFLLGIPLPGMVPVRYLSLTGPSLDPSVPPITGYDYHPLLPCTPCFWNSLTTDPTSPAFPGPFASVNFSLYFTDPDSTGIFQRLSIISVAGSNQGQVPEPSTWLLLSSGLAAVIVRRRFTKRS
jgi:hypothetical protein